MRWKDKYTTQDLLDADPEGEAGKAIVTNDTYALLEMKEELRDAINRLANGVMTHR